MTMPDHFAVDVEEDKRFKLELTTRIDTMNNDSECRWPGFVYIFSEWLVTHAAAAVA